MTRQRSAAAFAQMDEVEEEEEEEELPRLDVVFARRVGRRVLRLAPYPESKYYRGQL